jgi:Na+-driven multidrug efflux pump
MGKELVFICSKCNKEMKVNDKSCNNCGAVVVLPKSSIQKFKKYLIWSILWLIIIPFTYYFIKYYLGFSINNYYLILLIIMVILSIGLVIGLIYLIRKHSNIHQSGVPTCIIKLKNENN